MSGEPVTLDRRINGIGDIDHYLRGGKVSAAGISGQVGPVADLQLYAAFLNAFDLIAVYLHFAVVGIVPPPVGIINDLGTLKRSVHSLDRSLAVLYDRDIPFGGTYAADRDRTGCGMLVIVSVIKDDRNPVGAALIENIAELSVTLLLVGIGVPVVCVLPLSSVQLLNIGPVVLRLIRGLDLEAHPLVGIHLGSALVQFCIRSRGSGPRAEYSGKHQHREQQRSDTFKLIPHTQLPPCFISQRKRQRYCPQRKMPRSPPWSSTLRSFSSPVRKR